MTSDPLPHALSRLLVGISLAAVVLAPACKNTTIREDVSQQPPQRETVDGNKPILKAHMDDGDVYVLEQWTILGTDVVRGTGHKYDAKRRLDNKGKYAIPIDEVALFETNVLRPSDGIIAMTVVTGLSLAWTGICMATVAVGAKVCFGSCPTFYAGGGSVENRRPMAEGFSHAISPSLETTDIDMLPDMSPAGDETVVRMTNEAMETHVVRRVELHAARVPDTEQGQILRTPDGEFHRSPRNWEPTACRARTGDCRDTVAEADGKRYTSEADSENLAARETLELSYDIPDETRTGLAVTFRQSFITTFLFYQFLSDLGDQAVDFFARLERSEGSVAESFRGVTDLMGGIEVQVRRDDGWTTVGEVREAGPLADDTRLVVLPEELSGETDLRLRMAKGNWRIDAATLVEVGPPAELQRLEMTSVQYDGDNPESAPADPAARIRDESGKLVTGPGDGYAFRFELPDRPGRWEYYLESQGYYLEWMRQTWLEEKHPKRALEMLMWPSRALRTLAPEFKEREPEIEQMFWESRYVPSN